MAVTGEGKGRNRATIREPLLTLRVACGLPAASFARLLLPEPAVAQRIVRAKRKIRDAGIRLRVPDPGERPARVASVLRAIYLTFTEGHSPHGASAVVRDDLCEEALRLARRLHRLLPDEPEAAGLLALILLTSARAAARADEDGALGDSLVRQRLHPPGWKISRTSRAA